MSKFQSGQRVYLFNSLSIEIESDDVYGCLYVPVPVNGVEPSGGKSLSEKIASGEMVVKEQYQLCSHQGVIDAEVLFASEDECRKFYAEFFK